MKPLSQAQRAHRRAAFARHGIAVDVIHTPIDISPSSTHAMRTTLNATRSALPPNVPKAILAITEALLLPVTATSEDVKAALATLLASRDGDPILAANIDLAARRLGLSDRERKTLIAMKVDPKVYVANKLRMGLKPAKGGAR